MSGLDGTGKHLLRVGVVSLLSILATACSGQFWANALTPRWGYDRHADIAYADGARQRLDVSVNILTNHAVTNGKITVFGGSQMRPNLHIQDMCECYELLLDLPDDKIAGDIFNVAYMNMSIMDLARIVKKVVEEEFPEKGEIEIVTTPTDDIRSYHVNSDKIGRVLGFTPKYTIEDAVRGLCDAFRDGKLPDSMDDDKYFNVRRMKGLNAA